MHVQHSPSRSPLIFAHVVRVNISHMLVLPLRSIQSDIVCMHKIFIKDDKRKKLKNYSNNRFVACALEPRTFTFVCITNSSTICVAVCVFVCDSSIHVVCIALMMINSLDNLHISSHVWNMLLFDKLFAWETSDTTAISH